jgi:tetratricopeptide (TPR) repeat protein
MLRPGEWTMFEFVKQVARDFVAASSIEQIGFILSLSGVVTIVGAGLAFFGLRNRRAVIDALRQDAFELQSERDKAERSAARARAEIRLWNPHLWLEEAVQYRRAGNEEQAMEVIDAGLERLRLPLASATCALAGHHLSRIVGRESTAHLDSGERLARLSSLLDTTDADAAFLVEEAALARANGSVEDIPVLPASFAPADLGELKALVDAINSKGQDFIESGAFRVALRLFNRSLLLLRRGRMIEGSLGQLVRLKVAQCLTFCGRFEEAHEAIASLVAEQEHCLAKNDVTLLRSRFLLANVMSNQCRHRDALELIRKTIAAATPMNESDYIDIMSARSLEASCLTFTGLPGEALELANELLPRVSSACGVDHRNTLAIRHTAVDALVTLGRHAEALDRISELLPDQKRVLGDDHPSVFVTRMSQVQAEAGAGNRQPAIELAEALIPDMQAALGEQHPYIRDVIRFRDNLVHDRDSEN